jgi:hypothetical protein
MIRGMMPRMIPVAHAEQWAYAMQTGHGNHSIPVAVDSIVRQTGYIAARMLYEYYGSAASQPTSSRVLKEAPCRSAA